MTDDPGEPSASPAASGESAPTAPFDAVRKAHTASAVPLADGDAGPIDAAPALPTFGTATLEAVSPVTGASTGGTAVTLKGSFPASSYAVTLGGVPCASITRVDASTLRCITGSNGVHEGDVDVEVSSGDVKRATMTGAFHYFCPWTWGPDNAMSCGAVPPAHVVPAQVASPFVTTLQAGHGFTSTGTGVDKLNDTGDHVEGTQSASIRTAGTGVQRILTKRGFSPIDFTGKSPKVWVKVDAVDKVYALELRLGTSPTDYFRFQIVIPQYQQWATEGDWVSLAMPFGQAPVGHPDRKAITDVSFVVRDDGTAPVTLHVNGLALVDDTRASFPHGVVSFTFDDGYRTQATIAAPIMKAAGIPGTAYLINGLIGVVNANTYLTLDDAKSLQNDDGWEIGVHSGLESVHTLAYTGVTPAELETDIVSARSFLMSNGFNGYDHCAYPHGEFTPGTDVLRLVRKYFTSCRTIFASTRENSVPSDAAKLRVYSAASNRTLTDMTNRVDEAVANNEWLIFVFHNFSHAAPLGGHPNDWSDADFASLVDYVKNTGLPVKTVGQVLQN